MKHYGFTSGRSQASHPSTVQREVNLHACFVWSLPRMAFYQTRGASSSLVEEHVRLVPLVTQELVYGPGVIPTSLQPFGPQFDIVIPTQNNSSAMLHQTSIKKNWCPALRDFGASPTAYYRLGPSANLIRRIRCTGTHCGIVLLFPSFRFNNSRLNVNR